MTERDTRGDAATGQDGGAAGAVRLRDAIDRGGAGDKVAFSDPSAAPLGTDDEAAGTPPTQEQVRAAQRYETQRAPEAGEKRAPRDLQTGNGWSPWASALRSRSRQPC